MEIDVEKNVDDDSTDITLHSFFKNNLIYFTIVSIFLGFSIYLLSLYLSSGDRIASESNNYLIISSISSFYLAVFVLIIVIVKTINKMGAFNDPNDLELFKYLTSIGFVNKIWSQRNNIAILMTILFLIFITGSILLYLLNSFPSETYRVTFYAFWLFYSFILTIVIISVISVRNIVVTFLLFVISWFVYFSTYYIHYFKMLQSEIILINLNMAFMLVAIMVVFFTGIKLVVTCIKLIFRWMGQKFNHTS